MTLRKVSYGRDVSVEYVYDGKNKAVYFCGVDDIRLIPARYSVVNAARKIIQRIAAEPGIGELAVVFAILTPTNWVLFPGEYDFRQLAMVRVGKNTFELEWKKLESCPPEDIVQTFRGRIQGTRDGPVRLAPPIASIKSGDPGDWRVY